HYEIQPGRGLCPRNRTPGRPAARWSPLRARLAAIRAGLVAYGNAWNFSNCWRVMAMMWVNPMATLVLRPAPQFAISRPKVAEFPTVLPPQVSWTSCARVKDSLVANFELTFLGRYWPMVVLGKACGPP